MIHGSLFSGIGGFDLAAEWMGWTNAFHCEWEEFPRKVLQYHFPESKSYGDINETDFTIWNKKIDILTGGFPCQPYSAAGKRLGKEDERHLWPEMLRAIREIEPRWVIGENVYGLVNWDDGLVFEEVQVDLENEGYEVQPYILPAAGVNAPHKRDRVWFVAKNTVRSRLVQRESIQERTEVRQQRNTGTGGAERIHREKGHNATNTDKVRLQFSEDTRKVRAGQSQVCGARSEFADAIKADGEKWNATDTCEFGRGRGYIRPEADKEAQQPMGQSVGQYGNDVWSQNEGRGTDAANSNSIGQHEFRSHNSEQKSEWRKTTIGRTNREQVDNGQAYHRPNDFEQFPTQSPVCGGDDGIPRELDSITFPKWRNESIKAYGNAIVPQVAYQLFKTIKQFEKT